MLFVIVLLLVLFLTMKSTFSFAMFGNGGHGGGLLMIGGGNEFVAFVVIVMVGITCFSFGKLFLVFCLIMIFS